MDSFESETLSSDSSEPEIQTSKKVHTRKMRRTEDLISLDVTEDYVEKIKPTGKIRQDLICFLPKIELTDNSKTTAAEKPEKVKQNGGNLAKKKAVFKIGRSMIEGKQFQPTIYKSKFPKIVLKLNSKPKKGKENLLTLKKSDTSVKRKSNSSSSRKSFQRKNKELLRLCSKELYVNLVPLEKTDLLNAQQMQQLNKNKYNPVRKSSSYRAKTSQRKSSLCPESIVPCEVILERVSLEQIRVITSCSSNTANISKLPHSREIANNSIGNNESFFNPPGSSSPLTSSINLSDLYLEENKSNSNNSKLDSLLGKNNATFEIEAGPSKRKSSLNRKYLEELPQLYVYIPERITDQSSSNTTKRKSSVKNATYELNNSNTEISNKKSGSSDHDPTFNKSSELTSVPIETEYMLTENGKRRLSRDLKTNNQKKRRKSVSCDSSDRILNLSSLSAGNISKKRRSTLTLEDSVNDIAVLKSLCDTSGTPKKLNKSAKSNGETLIKKTLKKANDLDFSNITLRRHLSLLTPNDIETISSPWVNEPNTVGDILEIAETAIENDRNDTSEDEVEESDTSSTSSSVDESNLRKRKTGISGIIEISDDETESSSAKSESESDDETYLPKKGHRVTFDVDQKENSEKNFPPKVSVLRLSTPKSMLKNNSNKVAVIKNRRVTFSNMSVIIIDDHMDGSSQRTSNIDLVPTNFLPDDDTPDNSQFNEIDKHAPTPCLDSPGFNKRGTVGRTPKRLKSIENKEKQLNKRISSKERLRLQNDSIASPVVTKSSRKIKMPDFASIHKKMNDKMLNIQEYSKQRKERAQLLLSGLKPVQAGSSLKKSATKHESKSQKQNPLRKQLQFEQPSTSRVVPNKPQIQGKGAVVTSTPKLKKNEKNGATRFGYKANRLLTKKEQITSIANKIPVTKSITEKHRTDIKGVRSNRRFDLLMKMRNKQGK